MRPKNKLVHGIGVNDYEGSIVENGKDIISYTTWRNMLARCYSTKQQVRNQTYIECSVCDEWLSFSNFKIWFDENYIEGFALDKDILFEGNKIYSPYFCRFVPFYLNSLLTNRANARGELPIGITNNNGYYRAKCHNGYGKQLNKTFKTVEEASAWYSETKKRIVKEQAQRAFSENAIKTDIYLALVRRDF